MKNYFEYPFNEAIRKKLVKYYDNVELNQHSDNHQKKADLKIYRIEKQLSFTQSDTILDLGCSRGHISRYLVNKTKATIGIDISKPIIKENISNNTNKNLSYKTFNGIDIPLENNSLDKVILIDVLEHAFEPDELMKSIYSKLKKNGRLAIEVPFTGWLSEMLAGKYHQGHLRYYDPKYLEDYVKKFGFNVESVKTYNSVPFSSKLLKFRLLWKIFNGILNFIPARNFPYFGEIIIVCIK
jgi:SAM-dependent methyltransferase